MHDRRAGPLPEREQLEVEALAGQLVEGAERLVEEEHLRLEREGAGERRALAHPARQLADGASPRRRGRRGRRSSATTRVAPLAGPAGELEWIRDVVGDRPPRQQARLLEHEPDLRVRAVDRPPVERDRTALGAQQARRDPQQRALAAAVRTDEGDDLARRSTSRSTPSRAASGASPRRSGTGPRRRSLDAACRPRGHAA